jgi:hypothetical protein
MREAGHDGPLRCFWGRGFDIRSRGRLFDVASYGGSGDAPASDGEMPPQGSVEVTCQGRRVLERTTTMPDPADKHA